MNEENTPTAAELQRRVEELEREIDRCLNRQLAWMVLWLLCSIVQIVGIDR